MPDILDITTERMDFISEKNMQLRSQNYKLEQENDILGSEFCSDCGEPIPLARRKALRTEYCVKCQSEIERMERRIR